VVALYYATTENLPFDFTIKLCYTIIREGGRSSPTILMNGPAGSWIIEAGSWKMSSA